MKELVQVPFLTRSLRLEINKPESKYISREVKVNGGTSYEILFSSLEPELQQKLREAENKSTELVPLNYKSEILVTDKAKLTRNHRMNIVKAALEKRKNYKTIKESDSDFLDLYNTGLFLPKAYNFLGSISIGTLRRWIQAYRKHENADCLIPKYKSTRQGEYNTILDSEMKNILLTLLLHPSQYKIGKAIKLTKGIFEKRGYEYLPCDLTFKRYAENFRKNNYAEWVLRREGMKAYHDKVEPYIERDISKIEVGDIIIADGHVLNFQVINPFTGKPTRATLVGFLDWKSTALVGYEIMMTESTQCIASALRNSIINLGMIPKVVYQDNGRAFKSRFFQNNDFDENIFNGVYANLNIHSVFAKPYNARAKVIERFFLEFQEELEKGMPSYIGTSIENKPAWLKRGEKYTPLDILDIIAKQIKELKLVKNMPKNSVFYRVRILSDKTPVVLDGTNLGAPPNEFAKSDRMSARGISCFYASDNIETSKEEVLSDDSNGSIVVGEFQNVYPLKYLDLAAINNIQLPSVFDSTNYSEREAILFLKALNEELTRPISELQEIEYVPTQIFAEYFKLVQKLDGIKYNSSKNKNGTCYVLFFNNEQCIEDKKNILGEDVCQLKLVKAYNL